MATAMAGYTLNDAITKSLTDTPNAGQIMGIRGLFGSVLIGLLAWQQGALDMRWLRQPMVWLRALADIIGSLAFLMALANMPLANVSAVLQSLPLAVTMGAALFFREPVGWRRWLAIAIGFSGVMIIVRPGFEGFNIYALYALACVACSAMRDLITRRLPAEIPSLAVSAVTAFAITAGGMLLIVPMGGWVPMPAGDIGALFVASALLLVGYHFIVVAMRQGEISFVAPFRYTALLWAIGLGWLMFGDLPDGGMIAGAAIVIVTGIYTLYRERRGRALKPSEPEAAILTPVGPDNK